jgi:hypothetical protein
MNKLLVITLVFFITGCTHYYKPVSAWEEEAMSKASFDIFPNDVKGNIDAHKNSKVAWAGIVKSYEIDESTSPKQIIYKLEHHYFSWAIDGTTRQFWLSPRGEGIFTARWPFQEGWTEYTVQENIKINDLIVTYGIPKSITTENYIDLGEAYYMRLFPSQSYRTDVINYGRPGEPTKPLSLGLF